MEFYKSLQQSKNYREFLKTYLVGKSLNFSDFARQAGYGRSFPSDVIKGKRRLTPQSALAFEQALKLPLSGKKFFRLLVAKEEKDVAPELDRTRLANMIAAEKAKIWQPQRRQATENQTPQISDLLQDSRAMGIYAAMGEPQTGASLEEIQKRTRLYGEELKRNIAQLENAGLILVKEDRYFPKDLHLFLQTEDQSKILKTVFQKSCRSASEKITAQEASEMFFASQFCIREQDMPELKAALKETILKFVDTSISPEGDRVVRLLTALHF